MNWVETVKSRPFPGWETELNWNTEFGIDNALYFGVSFLTLVVGALWALGRVLEVLVQFALWMT